jgi:GT2 family glycosyltransferase
MVCGRQIDVSILVISQDTRAQTLSCLDAIRRQTRSLSYEVIVVDRASRDGSAVAIGEHPVRPRLFALQSDIGLARSASLAASVAAGSSMVLIGSRAVIGARAVDRLVELSDARPEALIWGGRVLMSDGRPHASSYRRRPSPASLLARGLSLRDNRAGTNPALFPNDRKSILCTAVTRQTDIVSDHFLLIRRLTWDALGGLDAELPEAAQVADLCLRAQVLGARPIVARAATATLSDESSTRAQQTEMLEDVVLASQMIARHWSPRQRAIAVLLLKAHTLATRVGGALRWTAAQPSARHRTSQIWAAHVWKALSLDRAAQPAATEAPRLAARLTAG